MTLADTKWRYCARYFDGFSIFDGSFSTEDFRSLMTVCKNRLSSFDGSFSTKDFRFFDGSLQEKIFDSRWLSVVGAAEVDSPKEDDDLKNSCI